MKTELIAHVKSSGAYYVITEQWSKWRLNLPPRLNGVKVVEFENEEELHDYFVSKGIARKIEKELILTGTPPEDGTIHFKLCKNLLTGKLELFISEDLKDWLCVNIYELSKLKEVVASVKSDLKAQNYEVKTYIDEEVEL